MFARLTAFILCLATLPAAAAPFLERHAHWTVMAAGPSACMAINRPPEEFNAEPYAALALRQRRGRPALLQVFAWPGVFKPGDIVTVAITVGGTQTGFPAVAADSYFVEAKEALPAQFIGTLREAHAAQFELSGVPQILTFDLTQIEAVMKSLEACMRQLPG